MPTTPSAHKSLRQSSQRRQVNRSRKSAMRTWIQKTMDAVAAKDLPAAEKSYAMASKWIDKNAKRNQIHRNTASRRKSRLALAIAKLRAQK